MSEANLIKYNFLKIKFVKINQFVIEINTNTSKQRILTKLFQLFNNNFKNNILTNSSNILWKKQFDYYEINDNVNYYKKEINTNKNYKIFNYEKTAKKCSFFTTFSPKWQSSFFKNIFWNFCLVFLLTLLSNFKSKKNNKYFYSIHSMTLLNLILFTIRYLILMFFFLKIINFVLFTTISTSMAAPIPLKNFSTLNLRFNNKKVKSLEKNQINLNLNINKTLKKQIKRRRHISLYMYNDAVENLAKKISDDNIFLLFFDESYLLDKNNKMNKFNKWLNLAKVN